ncbi:MAG: Gfo/Idh/MocA family oxidoreductase [Sedimentisphaerales bacterium]|nr:Gfo/Idh/MocA family oxidoreductase [Sedimentisphaerales bacterium]
MTKLDTHDTTQSTANTTIEPAGRGIDRRTFLRQSAAAGAGLMLTPVAFGQAAPGKDQINVALLGAGAEGGVLMEAATNIPGIRFQAVCDIWESYNLRRMTRLLQRVKHEARGYVDYKEMLAKEKDLDAVIIATPDFWHSEHTVACLEAGLHVYCEKEMSNTLEGARKMVEAQKRTGKLLQIGHQRRSNPRYLFAYDKIIQETNMLNRITTACGQWNRSREACEWITTNPRYEIDQATLEKYGYESMDQFRNWRWYKGLGGGPIVDLGSHQIDVFNWFLNAQPVSVQANGGTDYWTDREWYDTVMAIYEYETKAGKVRAIYKTGTTNSYFGYHEAFQGDHGTLVISEASGWNDIYREGWLDSTEWEPFVKKGYVELVEQPAPEPAEKEAGVTDVRESPKPPQYHLLSTMDKLAHQPHLENFFAAVRGEEKLNCPAEIGYETAVTVLKVNDAVAAEKKLTFTPDEFHA